jgi:hypothetical protein
MPFYGPSGGGATLEDVLEDFDENRALLMFSDFTLDISPLANRATFDLGCSKWIDGGGTMNQETANTGGLIYLNTSADGSGTSAAVINYEGGPADFAKDPRIKFKCNFEAANSALQAQAGGFNSARAPTDWDATSNDCAMFRSVTTGNLFAVTGSGSAETTTDLGSVYTLGNNAVFEIVSSGNGTSWAFKIDGTTRATHTSNLPDAKMKCIIGIANNTTTALRIDNLDYIWATQDRT